MQEGEEERERGIEWKRERAREVRSGAGSDVRAAGYGILGCDVSVSYKQPDEEEEQEQEEEEGVKEDEHEAVAQQQERERDREGGQHSRSSRGRRSWR